MKAVVLAGGVGGARMAAGLCQVLPPADLTVVVNTGDDFEHLDLRICPDLDTVMYTLAGIANRETGWGIAGDTFEALSALERVGGPAWFRLGDRDLATHLQRTALLKDGLSLTEVTARLCGALGVGPAILPMTDDHLATKIQTAEGELDFQDYFVRQRCEPVVQGIRFAGIDSAKPAAAVRQVLDAADGIVIAPSNPFVSVDPILALPGMRDLVASKPVVSVSPIVGGSAIKGPAAKMLLELGLDVSALGVARRYAGLAGGFIIDEQDAGLAADVAALGYETVVAQTVMRSDADREALGRTCLALLGRVAPKNGRA
ncbi:MAG TPA: 2-phospho-L-lactate transferase [Dehalococcoidia bacterium]|nr:2-phospho-L-lactate transferase [Dehalococcoidia bacterium]